MHMCSLNEDLMSKITIGRTTSAKHLFEKNAEVGNILQRSGTESNNCDDVRPNVIVSSEKTRSWALVCHKTATLYT
jgi:hypothetical protein